LTSNDCDFFECLPSKLDLSLKCPDVSQGGRRDYKVINIIFKTMQGGFYPEHFRSPYATEPDAPPATEPDAPPSLNKFKYNGNLKINANKKWHLLFI